MRVLVVDDDPGVGEALRRALKLDGYSVDVATSGRAGLLRAVSTPPPDALVLDVALPDVDGLTVCRRLRERGSRVPILMLSAKASLDDRVDGLEAGADDYLAKPFALGELQARLRAVLRRAALPELEVPGFAELRLDVGGRGAWVGERFVELTRTELDLLALLLRNPRRVLTHELIYDRVWDSAVRPESNALRVYVGYLRRKLEDAGARRLIHTVRGVGYVLREP